MCCKRAAECQEQAVCVSMQVPTRSAIEDSAATGHAHEVSWGCSSHALMQTCRHLGLSAPRTEHQRQTCNCGYTTNMTYPVVVCSKPAYLGRPDLRAASACARAAGRACSAAGRLRLQLPRHRRCRRFHCCRRRRCCRRSPHRDCPPGSPVRPRAVQPAAAAQAWCHCHRQDHQIRPRRFPAHLLQYQWGHSWPPAVRQRRLLRAAAARRRPRRLL
jgi:hypothetical protein